MLGTPIVHDRRFLQLLPRKVWAQALHSHGVFTEGPVWFADQDCGDLTSLWEACESGRASGEQSRLVRRAAAMLRDSADGDADRDENIEDVAHRLGYGKSRLYSLFTREVGMAPNDYRQRARIKRCCERLTKTTDSVTTIGIENGFQSSQYFARVFKKYVGVTPTDYRALFRPGDVR